MASIRKNNFDLIRLLAALQVLILHAREHLTIQLAWFDNFVNYFFKYFPGIHIFFFISGFLIYSSFERNKDNIVQFFTNRFLRIYPALWVCFIVTLCLLIIDFQGSLAELFSIEMLAWSFTQLTFLQFYTPEILRYWGVGTPNGSLWSISVEIQYYFLIPILYLLFSKAKNFWIPFIAVLVVAMITNNYIGHITTNNPNIISKLGWVFIVTHLQFFLVGILASKYWQQLKPYFEHKFWFWLAAYGLFFGGCYFLFGLTISSYWIFSPLNFFAMILLAGVTFSLAYSFYGLSNTLLKGNDISYGLYIYHMLVINFLVQRGYVSDFKYLLIVLLISTILATLSWKLVEKPSLKLKKRAVRSSNKQKAEKPTPAKEKA